MKSQYMMNYNFYTIKDLNTILSCIGEIDTKTQRGRGNKKKVVYYNIPVSFDIETSSWYEGENKRSCMYVWQFGIYGYVIVGRTWEELKKLFTKLRKALSLNEEKRLIIYVQNLSYEFQFMKNRFQFDEVFDIDDRDVIKAVYKGFEFRCSYILSGKKLEVMGKELVKYKVEKRVGDLDYSLVRHSKTILTEEELGYCINDVLVVMSYIQEKIEVDGDITKIPLTATGYIRKLCKDNCYKTGENRKSFHKFMKGLLLTEEVYAMCKDALMGGYVHGNPIYSGVRLSNVASLDFSSSYPAQMAAMPLFPMSSPILRENFTTEQFLEYLEKFCCLFDIKFTNLRLKANQYIAPLSLSKCNGKVEEEDNGRIVCGSIIYTTITEQDWDIINKFYDYDSYEVTKLYTFRRGYLPTEIIEVVMKLYEEKTKYKGVKEKEIEYMFAKAQLNSTYGMMVTDVFKQYDSIEAYNNSFGRFLYYPWGVWVTALARWALFTGIYEAGEDFVYCDTDSIKILNYEKHMDYINRYNEYIEQCLKDAMKYHGIDARMAAPSDINGQVRVMGVWTFEGVSEDFKALRAKAYISRKDGEYELTLSGVNKKDGIKYLSSLGDPIDNFKKVMSFPAGTTGKLVHTYFDDKASGVVTDYMGIECEYEELSYIHMEPCGYEMNDENEIIDFINFVMHGIYKK